MEQTLFFSFLLSVLLGAVIGSEREMPRHSDATTDTNSGVGFGGIRSYSLISLFGAIAVWLDIVYQTQYWVVVGMVLSALLIGISYSASSFLKLQLGVTSEYAALLTYFIGVMCMKGYYTVAVIVTIILTIILSSKLYIQKMLQKITREEFATTLKFAVIALVILPLLPDAKYSIGDIMSWISGGEAVFSGVSLLQMKFFNPYGIWFFVVIMSGVEFVAYILSKTMGEKGGIILSGAIGGLISSTATTAAMTEKSHKKDGNTDQYVVGTLVASTIMLIRVVAISGFYSPKILGMIFIPALVMFFVMAGATYYFYHTACQKPLSKEGEKKEYESPFRIAPALKFAGLILVIKFIAAIGATYKTELQEYLGSGALQIYYYTLGLISGLADVDAITQDMASKAGDGSIPVLIAASTILIAAMSNNMVKATIAYRLGEKIFGQKVFFSFVASILAGLFAILVLNFVTPVSASWF